MSARHGYSQAIDFLRARGMLPDKLGYARYVFEKIWFLWVDAHNSMVKGSQETRIRTQKDPYGTTWIKSYEIGQGVYVARTYYEDCRGTISGWDVEDPELMRMKESLMKGVSHLLNSIEIYIDTYTSYPKPGLNIESKMNEVSALSIVGNRCLLDAIKAYKTFLHREGKGDHSVGQHIESVSEFYDQVEEDVELLKSGH
jgi:hypothetical protein